jgi:hypothetical protein
LACLAVCHTAYLAAGVAALYLSVELGSQQLAFGSMLRQEQQLLTMRQALGAEAEKACWLKAPKQV